MIPNVVHGNDMRGLVKYLVSTDEKVAEKTGNQHVDPHVVSGDDFLRSWYGANILSYQDGKDIADYLERPRKASGTDIQRAVKMVDPESGKKVTVGSKSENVWHCSLSLAPSDKLVAEEQWGEIAQQFMDKMGFTEASGHAPASWVAIHHGAGGGGRDHIHIAASMVRNDGTKWAGRYDDFPRSQQACRELEQEHGLHQVRGRQEKIRERGDRPGERETAARLNFDLTIPRELGQRLRQAASASLTEDEFVRRARRNGLVLKPLYESGTTDTVRSYQAGLRPNEVQQRAAEAGVGKVSRWASIRSASTLGPDLDLDRLRADLWGPPGAAAVAEWNAAFKGQQPAKQDGPEMRGVAAESADRMASRWSSWHDRLAAIPAEDRIGWASAARDVSGAMHSYARFSDRPQDMRRAADSLARSAKVVGKPADSTPARTTGAASVVGTGWLLESMHHAKKSGNQAQIMATVVTQMIRTGMAIAEAHQARKADIEAQRIQERVIQPLQAEQARLINDPGQPHQPHQTSGKGREPMPELSEQAQQADRIGRASEPSPPRGRGATRGGNVVPNNTPEQGGRTHRPQEPARRDPERAEQGRG